MDGASNSGILIILIFNVVISSANSATSSPLNSITNVTHCMVCIANITEPIIRNLPLAKCTDGPPKRCGLYQISMEDIFNTRFPGKTSWKPCARDRDCSQRLIENKSSPCSSDSCVGHARDIFVGRRSQNCDESSPQFEQFRKCYDQDRRTDTPKIQVTTQEEEEVESMVLPIIVAEKKNTEYTSQRDETMFIGLIGSIVALIISVLVYTFRGKIWRKKKSKVTENPNGMALNKEYFERRYKMGDDDDVSSGFEDGTDSPTSDFPNNISMEPIVTRAPAPHVFFQHHLTSIEPLKEASGIGHFGSVCKAIYTNELGEVQKVAIKSLIRYNFNKVMEEAQIACLMDHPNVLKLLGIFIENETLKLVFPFMEKADLGYFLRKEKGRVSPSLLRSFSIEVASGMEYLASKKVVHRDLAARNCMLDADLHVKVADFGLSRKLSGSDAHHRMVATSVIPQSSAPESFLPGGKINEKTDVWAFGVTCWEIFNDAAVPPIMVQNDGTLIGVAPAKKCPNKIYEIMLRCWSYDQDQRPFFSDIYQYLISLECTDFVSIPTAPTRTVSQAMPRTYSEEPRGERLGRLCNVVTDFRGYVPKPDDEFDLKS